MYWICIDKADRKKILSTSYLIKMIGRNPKYHPELKITKIYLKEYELRKDAVKDKDSIEDIDPNLLDVSNFSEITSLTCIEFLKYYSDIKSRLIKIFGDDKTKEILIQAFNCYDQKIKKIAKILSLVSEKTDNDYDEINLISRAEERIKYIAGRKKNKYLKWITNPSLNPKLNRNGNLSRQSKIRRK